MLSRTNGLPHLTQTANQRTRNLRPPFDGFSMWRPAPKPFSRVPSMIASNPKGGSPVISSHHPHHVHRFRAQAHHNRIDHATTEPKPQQYEYPQDRRGGDATGQQRDGRDVVA